MQNKRYGIDSPHKLSNYFCKYWLKQKSLTNTSCSNTTALNCVFSSIPLNFYKKNVVKEKECKKKLKTEQKV